MPILNRLSSLLFADVHAVLDKLEDPHASLNLSVREMEVSLQDAKQDITALSARLEKLRRQGVDIAERIAGLDNELDVCFSSGEEELAKTVLRNKLMCENTLVSITKTIDEEECTLGKQQALYSENERRLISMREKSALYANEISEASENINAGYGPCDAVSDEAVEVAFLGEKQRRKAL